MERISTLLKKLIPFVKRYVRYPRFIITYALLFLQKGTVHASFYTKEELLSLLKNGKSFIRFGDGETFIMHGGSLDWQRYEKGLSLGMRKVIKDYSNDSPYVIGLPKFMNIPNKELKHSPEGNKMFVWLPVKAMFKTLCNKNMKYGDAHVFYYDNFFQDYFEPFLKDKHIILIANPDYIAEVKANQSIPFNMAYVEAPKKHAFSEYGLILRRVQEEVEKTPEGKIPVVIATIGPASKPLIYDLSRKGILSYDMGRGIENFYKNESLETMYPELTRNKKE